MGDVGSVLGDILNVMIIITILPTLFSAFGSIAGIDTSTIQPLLDLFTTLLPVLLIIQLFTGLFSAFGGRDEFGLTEILNILVLILVFPTLLNAISGVMGSTAGTTFDVSGIMEIFNMILPIVLLVKLIEGVTKAIK